MADSEVGGGEPADGCADGVRRFDGEGGFGVMDCIVRYKERETAMGKGCLP